MTKAVEAVKAQRSGLRAAARMYGVPVTSLKRRVETLDFHLRLGMKCADDIPDDCYYDQCLLVINLPVSSFYTQYLRYTNIKYYAPRTYTDIAIFANKLNFILTYLHPRKEILLRSIFVLLDHEGVPNYPQVFRITRNNIAYNCNDLVVNAQRYINETWFVVSALATAYVPFVTCIHELVCHC